MLGSSRSLALWALGAVLLTGYVYMETDSRLEVMSEGRMKLVDSGYLEQLLTPEGLPTFELQSYLGNDAPTRTKRNILFPSSGVKLCALVTFDQAVTHHLSCIQLRVCQETVLEAFKIFWDRLPKVEEYHDWVNRCQNGSVTVVEIGRFFSQSEEHMSLIKSKVVMAAALKGVPVLSGPMPPCSSEPTTIQAEDSLADTENDVTIIGTETISNDQDGLSSDFRITAGTSALPTPEGSLQQFPATTLTDSPVDSTSDLTVDAMTDDRTAEDVTTDTAEGAVEAAEEAETKEERVGAMGKAAGETTEHTLDVPDGEAEEMSEGPVKSTGVERQGVVDTIEEEAVSAVGVTIEVVASFTVKPTAEIVPEVEEDNTVSGAVEEEVSDNLVEDNKIIEIIPEDVDVRQPDPELIEVPLEVTSIDADAPVAEEIITDVVEVPSKTTIVAATTAVTLKEFSQEVSLEAASEAPLHIMTIPETTVGDVVVTVAQQIVQDFLDATRDLTFTDEVTSRGIEDTVVTTRKPPAPIEETEAHEVTEETTLEEPEENGVTIIEPETTDQDGLSPDFKITAGTPPALPMPDGSLQQFPATTLTDSPVDSTSDLGVDAMTEDTSAVQENRGLITSASPVSIIADAADEVPLEAEEVTAEDTMEVDTEVVASITHKPTAGIILEVEEENTLPGTAEEDAAENRVEEKEILKVIPEDVDIPEPDPELIQRVSLEATSDDTQTLSEALAEEVITEVVEVPPETTMVAATVGIVLQVEEDNTVPGTVEEEMPQHPSDFAVEVSHDVEVSSEVIPSVFPITDADSELNVENVNMAPEQEALSEIETQVPSKATILIPTDEMTVEFNEDTEGDITSEATLRLMTEVTSEPVVVILLDDKNDGTSQITEEMPPKESIAEETTEALWEIVEAVEEEIEEIKLEDRDEETTVIKDETTEAAVPPESPVELITETIEEPIEFVEEETAEELAEEAEKATGTGKKTVETMLDFTTDAAEERGVEAAEENRIKEDAVGEATEETKEDTFDVADREPVEGRAEEKQMGPVESAGERQYVIENVAEEALSETTTEEETNQVENEAEHEESQVTPESPIEFVTEAAVEEDDAPGEDSTQVAPSEVDPEDDEDLSEDVTVDEAEEITSETPAEISPDSSERISPETVVEVTAESTHRAVVEVAGEVMTHTSMEPTTKNIVEYNNGNFPEPTERANQSDDDEGFLSMVYKYVTNWIPWL